METSESFLDWVKRSSNDEAWGRLVELYSPLIRGWLARRGAALQDVDDVSQEVLAVVVRRFPEFQRAPRPGAFRAWLKSITANCLRDQWKRSNRQPHAVGGTDFDLLVRELADPDSELSRLWDREHDKHVSQFLLERIRPRFSESTWRAFQRFAFDGLSASDVAKELGMSENAVFIAKSRVMAALRDEGRGLID